MKEFLANFGLYQEYLLLENYSSQNNNLTNPYSFIGETFQYKCQEEDSYKTFELELAPETEEYYGAHSGLVIPKNLLKKDKLDFTFKVIGKCQSCKTYNIDFLLHVYSNNLTAQFVGGMSHDYKDSEGNSQKAGTNIYIQKVGANPQIKIIPDKIITKFFDKETNKWYFKGINSLNENYGIGSFAYFRRIIEKELINIIQDIKTLPDSHKLEIEKLLSKHKENPRISTIYDNIFEHLPNSLKSLGDNPIKLLYNQTSEGLHNFNEEECLNKAKSILKLLNFVLRKINEEKSELKDLREIIKGLK